MIRWAMESDAPLLAKVFYDAVRNGPSPYSEAQRIAWMPEPPSGPSWQARLATQKVAVAELDDIIVGFMSVQDGGYIDLAFIPSKHQGTGIFRLLYEHIENWAEAEKEPLLWTYASLMAQPAFKAMGFAVIHHETVARNGQSLARAKMEKPLR